MNVNRPGAPFNDPPGRGGTSSPRPPTSRAQPGHPATTDGEFSPAGAAGEARRAGELRRQLGRSDKAALAAEKERIAHELDVLLLDAMGIAARSSLFTRQERKLLAGKRDSRAALELLIGCMTTNAGYMSLGAGVARMPDDEKNTLLSALRNAQQHTRDLGAELAKLRALPSRAPHRPDDVLERVAKPAIALLRELASLAESHSIGETTRKKTASLIPAVAEDSIEQLNAELEHAVNASLRQPFASYRTRSQLVWQHAEGDRIVTIRCLKEIAEEALVDVSLSAVSKSLKRAAPRPDSQSGDEAQTLRNKLLAQVTELRGVDRGLHTQVGDERKTVLMQLEMLKKFAACVETLDALTRYPLK